MGPAKNFKLNVTGPNDLRASGKGKITNSNTAPVEEDDDDDEDEPEPEEPDEPDEPDEPEKTLTVSSPRATEGDDLVFTVNLSGTSGLVSLNVRPVSASSRDPGRDYTPPSVSSLSRTIASSSGGSFTFAVPTARDTAEEGSETLELHASVSSAGLSATGIGTILDRGAPTPEPSVPGGWAGTGDCDAGILMVKGTAYASAGGNPANPAGRFPDWAPSLRENENLREHYWQRKPSHSASVRRTPGKGIPEGLAFNGVRHATGTPSSGRAGEKVNNWIGGTISSTVRSGEYNFTFRWLARKTGGNRLYRSTGPGDYPCTVKVIQDRIRRLARRIWCTAAVSTCP